MPEIDDIVEEHRRLAAQFERGQIIHQVVIAVFKVIFWVTVFWIIIMIGGCERSPFEIWVEQQHDRCRAMGGRSHVVPNEHGFECYRVMVERMPKVLFTAQFDK